MRSGLRRGTVMLVPYSPDWEADFATEQAALQQQFGPAAIAIEHVGSTAVPGLDAKPIIDIEVGLRQFGDWQRYIEPLEARGYTFMLDRVGTDEVFLPKGPEQLRTHYVHITAHDSPQWRQTLGFRDRLRADAALRDEYQSLKQTLARRFPDDRQRYTAGKAAFIERNCIA